MRTLWAVILAFVIGDAFGIIEMAILGGYVDKWLDRREKKKKGR